MIHIDIKGLPEAIKAINELPKIVDASMAMSLNKVASGKALKTIKTEMSNEVSFPNGYLNQRMKVSKKANPSNLVVIIKGRDRPTSLARFANTKSVNKSRKGGVTVTVKPGRPKRMGSAFLMPLRNGNIGLALRLAKGESLYGKTSAISYDTALGKGLVLLYGPSVDQVMLGAATKVTPEIQLHIETEFFRNLKRLL